MREKKRVLLNKGKGLLTLLMCLFLFVCMITPQRVYANEEEVVPEETTTIEEIVEIEETSEETIEIEAPTEEITTQEEVLEENEEEPTMKIEIEELPQEDIPQEEIPLEVQEDDVPTETQTSPTIRIDSITVDGSTSTDTQYAIKSDNNTIRSIIANIHYENMDLSTPYNIWVYTFRSDGKYDYSFYDVNFVFEYNFRQESGDLRVSCKMVWPNYGLWSNMPSGLYHVTIDFQRQDNQRVGYGDYGGIRSMFFVRGIASVGVVLDEELRSGFFSPAIATTTMVEKGLPISIEPRYQLDEGNTYTTKSYIYRVTINEQGQEEYELIHGPIDGSFVANADNVSRVPLGVFDDLDVGLYTVRTNVFAPNGQDISYDDIEYVHLHNFKIVEVGETMQESSSIARMRFHSYDENNAYLPDSKFQIMKDGSVIHEWTSGDSFEEIDLEQGSYTLLETDVPTGYQKNSPIEFTVENKQAYIRGDFHYGKTISKHVETLDKQLYTFEVTPIEGEQDAKTGYCFFSGKYDPTHSTRFEKDDLVYKEYLGTEELLYLHYSGTRYTSDQFYNAIRRVLYLGYPNNFGGLMEKYSLTEEDFQYVTQEAVHHFTNHKSYDNTTGVNSENAYAAYQEMIALAMDDSVVVPDYLRALIYIPSNENYQEILIAQLYEIEPMELEIPHSIQEETPIDIPVQKVWKNDTENDRPESITIKLLADRIVTQTVELTAQNNWTYTFTDLPQFKDGVEIVYEVEEVEVEGYETSIDGYTITNTKIEEEPPKEDEPPKEEFPDTSVKTNTLLYLGLLQASLIGLLVLKRRKNA